MMRFARLAQGDLGSRLARVVVVALAATLVTWSAEADRGGDRAENDRHHVSGHSEGSHRGRASRAPRRLCPVRYELPGDISLELPAEDGQSALDRYSWKIFLALAAPGVGERVSRKGDNETQWDNWSSTVDLIQCNLDSTDCICPGGDCSISGARYYPPSCQAIEGYRSYRALAQLAKVDDSFLEAEPGRGGNPRGGLTNSALIDSRGGFVRYEIMTSPVTYQYVVENQYYNQEVLESLTEPVTFPCGEESYRGGNPADPRVGAMTIKNAWMEISADTDEGWDHRERGRDDDHTGKRGYRKLRRRGGGDQGIYHTEKLLVYDPSYRSSTGHATCELKTMALIGQHIAHKTTKQPRWTWSTFEHRLNAPNCTELPPDGLAGVNPAGAGPSKACPSSVRSDYNLYPKSCSQNGSDPDACQVCNTPPASNAPDCSNPNIAVENVSYCLDLPPAPIAGTSKTCRQVPVEEYYPESYRLNQSCARRLGKKSVWSNYQLISTMWYNVPSNECRTVQEPGLTFRVLQQPQVPIKAAQAPGAILPAPTSRPYLANTSMETDVRSDCMGCHSAAKVTPEIPGTATPGTDFMYWLQLEVPGGPKPE